MGSRTSETLSEIARIRERLDGNLVELEQRLPPLARKGRAAVRILGGGVGGGVLLFAARRLASHSKRKAARAPEPPAQPQVIVRGGVGSLAALGAAAIWAGVRIYEARLRAQERGGATAELRAIPGERRA